MTQRKLKRGDPVIMPSGLVAELTDIQYEHKRYRNRAAGHRVRPNNHSSYPLKIYHSNP